MNPLRKAWCRTFQTAFRIALPVLPYREPQILNSVEAIPAALAEKGIDSVLLVTDPGIARVGLTHGLEDALERAGISCAIFSGTVANPTIENVEHALSLYRANSCQAIIGFGGGSSMDCAKAVGARVARPGKTIGDMRGLLRVHHRLPLLIAVPTTAGTGSEVTLAAVITDEKTRYKYPINDFFLIPSIAVHDWHLTAGLPASLTGQTGMDALTHAVEAFIGRSTTAHTREMALDAVRLIHDNLLEAFEDGNSEAARRNMLTASYEAGIAFTQSYVGYVHAIAHSLGGMYGIPHGLANAVILPHVLRAYGDAAAPKLAILARHAGIASTSTSDHDASRAFIRWIEDMNGKLGIPKHLDGIRAEDLEAMAAHADAEANPLYPVPVLWDRADLEHMYRIVAGGRFADEPAFAATNVPETVNAPETVHVPIAAAVQAPIASPGKRASNTGANASSMPQTREAFA